MKTNNIKGFVFVLATILVFASLISLSTNTAGAQSIFSSSKSHCTSVSRTSIAPSICLVSPFKGTINTANPLNVKWQGTNLATSGVDIALVSKTSNVRYVLATSTVNRGSTTINIASSTIPEGKYHLEIKASDATLADVKDRSDEVITVKTPQLKTLTITSGPQATLSVGGTASVSWTNAGNVSKVNVYLVASSTTSPSPLIIDKNVKNKGSYSLKITSRLSGSYYFKIEDSVTSSVFATSSLFSITPVTLTVSPLTQSSVKAGQPMTVSWSDTGMIKSFSIKVVPVLGGSSVAEKIVKSQGRANADFYTWKTLKSQTPGGYYFVVSDVLNPQITATSSVFQVTPKDSNNNTNSHNIRDIQVSTRTATTTVARGALIYVSYTTNYSMTGKVLLVKDGNYAGATLLTRNSSAQGYTVPTTVATSTNYVVRVEDVSNSAIFGTSTAFSII
jgi:hypothetical protein